ncbi:uncharacterized protein Tco025E_02958 [Trypanosoma conorhini]|uniref:Uncharacterized protein n=1 Tax=Trypanosoma conorhini TaxID=83891 RepID=A0A422PZK6_9TRYP|nr:uncharacterized protein Tco025E_02958 [Trypanosoma conorhini]RNF23158.1 hypothetical protein Tco025E_02958 [Trypanosoma conorhini]
MAAAPLLGCCAPFTLTAGVILFTLAAFMQHGSWTFEVLAAKEGWSLEEKAKCCRNAAIFYVLLSAALWVALGLMRLLGKKARHRESPPDAAAGVEDAGNDGDDSSDRMGHRHRREAAPLLQGSAL